jgi:predicted nuclease with RNAse H fold
VTDEQLVIGIDIAASRPCTAVALRCGRVAHAVGWMAAQTHRDAALDDTGAMLDWIERLSPAAVAVDAPQGYNRRLLERARGHAASRSRVCDHELLRRRISLYQVPSRKEVAEDAAKLPAWMTVGFRYFKELKRRGFEAPPEGALAGAFGAAPAVLEVFPYATFVTLLGGLLSKKSTREGLRLRVLALREAGVRWDAGDDAYFDHDSLDALAAALTAWRFIQGRAHPVGDEREGLLWLPVTREELGDAPYAPLPPAPRPQPGEGPLQRAADAPRGG